MKNKTISIRFAIFTRFPFKGEYMIIIKENDINFAEKWGGFVKWVGGIRKRYVNEYGLTLDDHPSQC